MTTYLVVSDLELLGPDEPKFMNFRFDEAMATVVDGGEAANLAADKMGVRLPRYGVTVYKVVEVAHYKPKAK